MARIDEAAFMDSMEAAIDKYVKQQARNTIALNAERDPACAGYARLPGPDACDFCITMGAASDFYHTRETAGGGAGHGTADDRYHPYCNCGVCLVFRRGGSLVARDPDTGEVVDYDGADMIRRYNEAGRPTFAKGRAAEGGGTRGGGHGAGRLTWKQAAKHADRLEAAASAEELRAIGAEIERAVPKAAKSSAQWKNLQTIAQRRMRELEESTRVELSRIYTPVVTKELPKMSVKFDSVQMGHKIGKHARDFGLDPAKESDRDLMQAIIDAIIRWPDEVVEGAWRDQPNPCSFYIRENDVVVVNANDEFVTVLRDGKERNSRVRRARHME